MSRRFARMDTDTTNEESQTEKGHRNYKLRISTAWAALRRPLFVVLSAAISVNPRLIFLV